MSMWFCVLTLIVVFSTTYCESGIEDLPKDTIDLSKYTNRGDEERPNQKSIINTTQTVKSSDNSVKLNQDDSNKEESEGDIPVGQGNDNFVEPKIDQAASVDANNEEALKQPSKEEIDKTVNTGVSNGLLPADTTKVNTNDLLHPEAVGNNVIPAVNQKSLTDIDNNEESKGVIPVGQVNDNFVEPANDQATSVDANNEEALKHSSKEEIDKTVNTDVSNGLLPADTTKVTANDLIHLEGVGNNIIPAVNQQPQTDIVNDVMQDLPKTSSDSEKPFTGETGKDLSPSVLSISKPEANEPEQLNDQQAKTPTESINNFDTQKTFYSDKSPVPGDGKPATVSIDGGIKKGYEGKTTSDSGIGNLAQAFETLKNEETGNAVKSDVANNATTDDRKPSLTANQQGNTMVNTNIMPEIKSEYMPKDNVIKPVDSHEINNEIEQEKDSMNHGDKMEAKVTDIKDTGIEKLPHENFTETDETKGINDGPKLLTDEDDMIANNEKEFDNVEGKENIEDEGFENNFEDRNTNEVQGKEEVNKNFKDDDNDDYLEDEPLHKDFKDEDLIDYFEAGNNENIKEEDFEWEDDNYNYDENDAEEGSKFDEWENIWDDEDDTSRKNTENDLYGDTNDAGKDMLESAYHFDSNIGLFGGAKVIQEKTTARPWDKQTNYRKGETEEERESSLMSFYTLVMLLSLLVIFTAFILMMNKHKVERYMQVFGLTRGPMNNGHSYSPRASDEHKILIKNEYA